MARCDRSRVDLWAEFQKTAASQAACLVHQSECEVEGSAPETCNPFPGDRREPALRAFPYPHPAPEDAADTPRLDDGPGDRAHRDDRRNGSAVCGAVSNSRARNGCASGRQNRIGWQKCREKTSRRNKLTKVHSGSPH